MTCIRPSFVLAGLLLAAPLSAADLPPPGASSCAGCHAVSPKAETSVPRLNGVPAAQIVAAMQDFKSGKRPATVMDRLAKGFTDDQIKAIARWYQGQK